MNHYLIFGAKEGRENFTSFDGLAYAERYPDLKEAYGDDLLALYKHYQAFGQDEGRNAETYDEPEDVEEEDEDDEDDGTYTVYEYYEDGSVKSETVYTNGKIISRKNYSLTGSLLYEEVNTYDSNGQLSRHENWVHSTFVPYWQVIEYVNGIKVRDTSTIYSNKYKVTNVYVTEYDNNGKETKVTEYDSNGKKTKVTEYDADGKVTNTETF